MNREGNRVEYNELGSADIGSSRRIVISGCSKGGYTMAQQLVANEGNAQTKVFLKGAFHIEDIRHLRNLRDIINVALEKEEEETGFWEED